MNLENVREELERLLALVQGWITAEEIPSIERDLALDKIKSLYDELRFARAQHPEPAVAAPRAEEPAAAAAPAEEPEAPVLEVIDLDEVILSDVPLGPIPEVSAGEPARPEPEPGIREIPASDPEPCGPVEEGPTEETDRLQHSLFDLNEMPVHRRETRRVLMSLYGDEPVRRAARPRVKPDPEAGETLPIGVVLPEREPASVVIPEPVAEEAVPEPVAAEPEPAEEEFDEVVFTEEPVETVSVRPEPVPEGGPVLGEVIGADRRTLADTIAAERSVVGTVNAGPVDSLRSAIGINDRFLLIGELFGGDAESCDRTIEKLDGMESLDDCLIYLAENHTWNSNSDGAKLLFELLERKYGEC